MSVNKVILIGNVGGDPETKYLDNGTPLCRFSLATNEVYKNKNGEKVTQTEWHNIILWRGLAEVAEKYVKKGTQIYLEGRIRTRSWDDQDGNKKYTTEIVGDSMKLLSRRQDNMQEPESTSSTKNQSSSPSSVSEPSAGADNIPEEEDDLPF